MERPFILVNMAVSVDGKITSAAREYPRMTSDFDRRNMDRLRTGVDAVLIGAGTLRADDPHLHVRTPEMRERRRALGKAGLLKIVVTAGLDLDPSSRFFDDADGGGLLVATVEDAPDDRLAELDGRAEVWPLGRGRVDVEELVRRLKRRGVERLLVEGGGELNWCFLERDLVDELYVTVAPVLLGGRDAPTMIDGAGLSMNGQRRLELLDLHREGNELYCRWSVIR